MIRLELRDKSFTVLEILDREYLDLSWSYSRIGGCGEFSFGLPRELFEEGSISGDFNVRIYSQNQDTRGLDLWYQGLVEDKVPSVRGNSEKIEISGHGYSVQLPRIYIDQTFSNTEISLIVASIIGTDVSANTDIIFDASLIATTSFTPDELDFNDDAQSAIQKCADIVGGIEWGVDRDRKFFFKAKDTEVGLRLPFGKDITKFTEDIDFRSIVNRAVVQGAQVGGTYYQSTYNEDNSQLKYNLRTSVLSNSSILTDAVASQYATAYFADYAKPQRRANCDLIGFEGLVEATVPLSLVNFIVKNITYGTRKYGTFLYSGIIDRQINRISYSVKSRNSLSVSIDFGLSRPNISEQFNRIEYNLDQQRSAAL